MKTARDKSWKPYPGKSFLLSFACSEQACLTKKEAGNVSSTQHENVPFKDKICPFKFSLNFKLLSFPT